MPLTHDQRKHQAIGQRLLERDMIDRGLIHRQGLHQSTRGENRRGAMARERRVACDRLEAALERDNLRGREQMVNDALRVLDRKRPRYLDKSAKGRRLLKKLRRARRALASD